MIESFIKWPNTNMKEMKITYRELEQGIKLLQSPDKEVNQLSIELFKTYNIEVLHTIYAYSYLLILDEQSVIYVNENRIVGKIIGEMINDLQIFYAK